MMPSSGYEGILSQLITVPELLNHHARENPGKPAFLGPGWEVTYEDLEKRTRRIAAQLVRRGVGRGQFVAIALDKCLEAVESIFAVTRAGAVGVPLDPRSPALEIANVLDHSGARTIITDVCHSATVCAAAKAKSMVVIIDEFSSIPNTDGIHQIVRYQDWVRDVESSTRHIGIDELSANDEAFLHYTSGTTSTPKGVLSNQASWLCNVNSFVSVYGMTPADRIFWPLPLFHCLGHLMCIIMTVSIGASSYLAGSGQNLLESLTDEPARETTLIVGAPTTFKDLVESLRLLDTTVSLSLPKLRACMYAGSSAPFSLSLDIQKLLRVPLLNNYGCTECCGPIAVAKPDQAIAHHANMTVLPHWEIKLVDLNGNKVKNGEQGEIWVRGAGLMLEYYKMSPLSLTADGWFPTGDVAVRANSRSGTELRLVGRTKEIIIRGGENIHPQELEHILLQQPGIADIVVAGIPHTVLGEVPAAFIVKSDKKHGLELSALLRVCRKSLPDYKVPCAFYEIDVVPRTAIGKPKRFDMMSYTRRPLTLARALRSKATIDSLVITETIALSAVGDESAEEEFKAKWLRQHFDQPFSFLGLSSMASIVLRDRLASLTGLADLPNTLVFDHPTPEAMCNFLYGQLLDLHETPSPQFTNRIAEDIVYDPIAIVSMACRYPGGINSAEDLWQLVMDEVDATSDFPDDRGWDIDSLYSINPEDSQTSTTKRGGFLHEFAEFDAGLFGMAPREALATDPQHRLLLETTWELAERGGIAPLSLQGSQTGVFVGTLYDDYEDNGLGYNDLEAYLGLGSSGSVISGRISYHFGLHGPSLAISTGCSSSLVAVHLAAQSLRTQECTLAIAGGVTTMSTPRPFTTFSRRRGLSSDGRCRAYSSDASGTGWSEGVGLILLERLSDAKRNGHQILSLIRGSSINSDGKSNGLTAPNGLAQQMCIRSALAQARLSPSDVDVLEGHGTATPLGDPIEAHAIIDVYGNGSSSDNSKSRLAPLLLGSVKSNIGHTQAAAAIASIIKMVQAMRYGVAPASLHIHEPSPQVSWKGSGVKLLRKTVQWPSLHRPRRAAVSSFGIGGTNGHIILEQPEPVEREARKSKHGTATFPLLLSGASELALRAQAGVLLKAWRQAKDESSFSLQNQCLVDIAFSLAVARSSLKYKAAIMPTSGLDLHKQFQLALESLAQGELHPDVKTNVTSMRNGTRLAFLFSGQGKQIPSAASLKNLCSTFFVFDVAFREACGAVNQHLACPLFDAMQDGELMSRTEYAQAAFFVFEVAMFRLLQSFNVRPDFVTGHSLGEIIAAHCAGALCLSDAATIVTTRATLMATLSPTGGMVSISATKEKVAKELVNWGGVAVIAALNSQSSVVVSGTQAAITTIADRFSSQGHRVSILPNIQHGFHSPMMDAILADLTQALPSAMKAGEQAKVPLISTVTGKRADTSQLQSPKHWVRHVREPVRFSDAINQLVSIEHVSVFLEIGPSAILSSHVPDAVATYDTVSKLLKTLGELWVLGVPINWRAVFDGTGAQIVDLPVYAFQRQRFWLPYRPPLPVPTSRSTMTQPQAQTDSSGMGHVLLNIASIPGTGQFICSGLLSTTLQPWLRDHLIMGKLLIPATTFVEIAMRASQKSLQSCEAKVITLDELVVIAPLVLSLAGDTEQAEAEVFQIQVLIGEPGPENDSFVVRRGVEVYSRLRDATTLDEWTLHASGSVTVDNSPSPDDLFSVRTSQPILETAVDVSKSYDILAEKGIKYGPSFQCVRKIWRTHDNCLIAKLSLPQSHCRYSPFILHPAVLDAALHAHVLASAEECSHGDLRLPFALRGLQIFGKNLDSETILVRIHLVEESCISLELMDYVSGVKIATVSEVELRAWTPPLSGGKLYRLEWTEIEPKPFRAIAPTTDKIIRMQRNKYTPGSEICKTVHNQVAEALRALQEWGADKTHVAEGERLVFVTENATSVGNTAAVNLVSSAVWGFVRSAQAEFGAGRIVLVDEDGSGTSDDALSQALIAGEDVVSIRSGRLLIPKLSIHPIIKESPDKLSLDISGIVLITGGTGALGAALSRDIVQSQGARRLLLISRSGLEAPGARVLYNELRRAGVDLRIEACDASNFAELAALLQNDGEFLPITSVIHCAGVTDDSVLASQTAERMSRVLSPKVDAAWNLHQLLPDTLRTFVLFSSHVGVVGNEGQAAYSAGNAFLDGLARFRVAQGLPALSLAWGPWANTSGMAAEIAIPNQRISNAQPFTDQQALHLFYKALQIQAHTLLEPVFLPLLLRGPFPLVYTKSKTNERTTGNKFAIDTLWCKKLSTISNENQYEILLSLVRDEIATVLGYEDQNLLPQKLLSELGFDSFTSVMLTNRLRLLTGLDNLPVTLALDYDTVRELAQHVFSQIRAKMQSGASYGTVVLKTHDARSIASHGSAGNGSNMPSITNASVLWGENDDNELKTFRGLAKIHKPDPQRLVPGPSCSSPSEQPWPLILIAPFFPRIKIEGVALSVYKNLASAISGQRDVFELPHPEGQELPKDLATLVEIHAGTIRRHFAKYSGIILAGYSAGGAVAYAVASELARVGHKPRLIGLALIDTYLQMTGRSDPDWLNALPAEALSSHFYRSGANIQNRNGVGGGTLVGDLDWALAKTGGLFRTLRDWNMKLYPLPDELHTLFVRALDPSDKMPKDANVWRPEWSRASTIIDVPGSHLALLNERYAPAIAADIQRWAKEQLPLSRSL